MSVRRGNISPGRHEQVATGSEGTRASDQAQVTTRALFSRPVPHAGNLEVRVLHVIEIFWPRDRGISTQPKCSTCTTGLILGSLCGVKESGVRLISQAYSLELRFSIG